MQNDPSIHHEVGVNHLSDLSDVERQRITFNLNRSQTYASVRIKEKIVPSATNQNKGKHSHCTKLSRLSKWRNNYINQRPRRVWKLLDFCHLRLRGIQDGAKGNGLQRHRSFITISAYLHSSMHMLRWVLRVCIWEGSRWSTHRGWLSLLSLHAPFTFYMLDRQESLFWLHPPEALWPLRQRIDQFVTKWACSNFSERYELGRLQRRSVPL